MTKMRKVEEGGRRSSKDEMKKVMMGEAKMKQWEIFRSARTS